MASNRGHGLIDLARAAESDLRESPRYGPALAAHFLQISTSTLQSWVTGRDYPVSTGVRRSAPLIRRPDPNDPRLSFNNLVELHVVRALRQRHRVKMETVRNAIDYAENRLGIKRILLSDELRAAPGSLLLDRLSSLLDIGASGQEALREILEQFLQRIDRDSVGFPLRLFPFTRSSAATTQPKSVVIDARLAFGQPVLASRPVRTRAILERFEAGESISSIAGDYGVSWEDVEEALRFETPDKAA